MKQNISLKELKNTSKAKNHIQTTLTLPLSLLFSTESFEACEIDPFINFISPFMYAEAKLTLS